MKICMCLGRYYPVLGGPGRSAFVLSQELAKRGIEVIVVCRKYPGLKDVETVSRNHTIYRVTPLSEDYGSYLNFASLSTRLFVKATKLVRNHGVALVHAHEISFGGAAGLLLKLSGCKTPTVLKYGGDLVFEFLSQKRRDWNPVGGVEGSWQLRDPAGRLAFLLQSMYLSEYDHVYANSLFAYRILRKVKVSGERISLIQNGVMLDEFSKVASPIKEQLGIKGTIVMAAGRFVRWKGFDIAIEALKIVLRTYPDTYLVLVGDGEEEAMLRRLAEEYCPGRVIFTGPVGFKDMVKYYSASEVFVLPSYNEAGMPNVLLEAMACEVPVVASNISSVEGIVSENATGFLFAPGDPQSLAEKIVECLSDTKKAHRIGEAGRRLVERNFSHRKMVDEIVRLYDRLV